MSETLEYSYPLHYYFFAAYVVVGSTLCLMNIQIVLVIRWHSSLWNLSAYRFLLLASIADAVNCASQVAAVAITFRTPAIDEAINLFIGTIFQTTYSIEYPLIFVLAVNRFIAVIFPHKMSVFFTRKISTMLMIFCCIFGGFNCAICLSGEIQSLWDPMVPAFYFTNQTTPVAIFMLSMDLYLSEFVQITSLIIYIILIAYIGYNRKRHKRIRNARVELPLLFHSICSFVICGVLLYFWYNPISNTQLYTHSFNLLIIIRFGLSPISLLLTNQTVRARFFRFKKFPTSATSTQMWHSQRRRNEISCNFSSTPSRRTR